MSAKLVVVALRSGVRRQAIEYSLTGTAGTTCTFLLGNFNPDELEDITKHKNAYDGFGSILSIPWTTDGEIDVVALSKVPLLTHTQHQLYEDRALRIERRPPVRNIENERRKSFSDAPPSNCQFLESFITRGEAYADGGKLSQAGENTNLVSLLAEQVMKNPHKMALCVIHNGARRETITFSELWQRAECFSNVLAASDLRRDDCAILQIDDLSHHFYVFWACLMLQIRPVAVAIPKSYRQQNAVRDKLINTYELISRDKNVKFIVSKSNLSHFHELDSTLFRHDSVVTVDECQDFFPVDAERARDLTTISPDSVAFYQLSSGSTGTPKCIQITHRGVIAHAHGEEGVSSITHEDITLNWLPLDHVVPILTVHCTDMIRGNSEIQVNHRYILDQPLRWLSLLQEFRVTRTWCPNFGFNLIADTINDGVNDLDLSHVKYFMNAGEQVVLNTLRRFYAATKRFGVAESSLQPSFGMAEACTCMTYKNDFSLQCSALHVLKKSLGCDLKLTSVSSADTATFVSLGPPVPGVEIRITDGQNNLRAELQIGRLQIRGSVITPGYLHNDVANNEAFVGDGWFNSGDIGFMYHGELYLTGREKEMIVVRGANYYCYEIEDVVSSISGVAPTFAAAFSVSNDATEEIAIAFVPRDASHAHEVARAVQRQVTERLGIAPAYVIPLSFVDFPKTTSGKIQRTKLKLMLEDGEFEHQVQQCGIRRKDVGVQIPLWFHEPTWVAKDGDVEPKAKRSPIRIVCAVNKLRNELETVLTASGFHVCESGRIIIDMRAVALQCQTLPPLEMKHGDSIVIVAEGMERLPLCVYLRTCTMVKECDAQIVLLDKYSPELLASELSCDSLEDTIAYIGLKRHVMRFKTPQIYPHPHTSLKGKLLVTGALGRVGMVLCAHLLENGAFIIAVGRSPEEKIKENLASLRLFGSVEYIQSDVSNLTLPDDLDGILHLAGSTAEGIDTTSHIAKVEGFKWLLSESARQRHPPFVIAFSSVLSLFNSPKYAAYGWSNSMLNLLSQQARDEGRLVYSLCFPTWQLRGTDKLHGFSSITEEEALFSMHYALRFPAATLLIGMDPTRPLFSERFVHESIADDYSATESFHVTDVRGLCFEVARRDTLEAKSSTEQDVAAVLRHFTISVDMKMGLAEHGIDSMTSLQFISNLRARGYDCTLGDLFSHRNLVELADTLAQRLHGRLDSKEQIDLSLQSHAEMFPHAIVIDVLPTAELVSKLIGFVGVHRILNATDFASRVQRAQLQPHHVCLCVHPRFYAQAESLLRNFEGHHIEIAWLDDNTQPVHDSDRISCAIRRNGHVSWIQHQIEVFDEFTLLLSTGVNMNDAKHSPVNVFAKSSSQVAEKIEVDELYQYPLAGRAVSCSGSTSLEWYHPSKHDVFVRAVACHFGSEHPVCTDRELFDWQYKGGTHVVQSEDPPAVMGSIPCRFDHSVRGLHSGGQMAMFYVSADSRSSLAIEALQSISMTVAPNQAWSSLVVMVNRETALPFLRAYGYSVMDPMPRYIRHLSSDDCVEPELLPWASPDQFALAEYWNTLQMQPVTAVHRDVHYWTWRYISRTCGESHAYKIFKLPNCALSESGLVVARVEHHALRIIELLPPSWHSLQSSNFITLLESVLSWGVRRGCNVADFWCSHSGLGELLIKYSWCNQFDSAAPCHIKCVPQIFTADGTGRDAPRLNIAFMSAVGSGEQIKLLYDDLHACYFVKSDGDMDRPPPRV